MCEPTTIAMVGMAIVSAVATVDSQDKQAQAINQSNDRQYEADMDAYRGNLAQSDLQAQQATKQASQRILDNSIQARQASSTATVQAGENGISGLSVDALLGDIDTRQTNYDNSIVSNLRDTNAQLDNQRANIRTNTASQINSLKAPQSPDYVGAALKIGGAGLAGYDKYKAGKK